LYKFKIAKRTKFYSLPLLKRYKWVGHASYPGNSNEETSWEKVTWENKE
jgi:hypothetical protein